jgi:Patatin-like phospholipase
MQRIAAFALPVLLAFSAGGCAIKPMTAMRCELDIIPVETPPPSATIPSDAAPAPASLGALFSQSLTVRAGTDAGNRSLLFMSGGGQHGAFGAGLLSGWAEKNAPGGLPHFDVVTGVSTGAILSTAAFINDPDGMVAAYTLANERVVLKPYVKLKNGKLTTGSYFNLMRKGALADLDPFRNRLRDYLTKEVLLKVAGSSSRRQLLVGAVDVDAGKAVAFDLKAMAIRYKQAVDANDKPAQIHARDCYAEAIVASASAPLAASPVFINGRMYVDGGVRYGVFSESVTEGLRLSADRLRADGGDRPGAPAPLAPDIYLIINGTLESHPECDESVAGQCTTVGDITKKRPDPHASWNFPGLALRSSDLMTNQIYRFSAAAIDAENRLAYPKAEGQNMHFARIGTDMPTFPFTYEGVTKNCEEWREADQIKDNPVQFYPRYMRCLIAYGKAAAAKPDWP